MAATTHLLTVRETPKWDHLLIQRNLRRTLQAVAEQGSMVETELAFQPVADGELRVADVAWISAQRLHDVDPEGYFQGIPELVIEVLSPSNTASDLYDRESLCLSNGGLEFWVVDPARRQIQVSTPDRRTVTYTSGEQVILPPFGGSSLPVDQILAV